MSTELLEKCRGFRKMLNIQEAAHWYQGHRTQEVRYPCILDEKKMGIPNEENRI
jgi:hypothetical protein